MKLKSTIIPIPIDNIDTDQIIPARFLKSTTRVGFGENLFRDWRYDKTDQPNLKSTKKLLLKLADFIKLPEDKTA